LTLRAAETALDPRRIPGVRMVRGYRMNKFPRDAVAAIAVTALMIPHGMAYAELAGVPAVTGLYTTVAAVLVYALLGPSRLLLLGPDSSLAPLIAAAIALVVTDGDPAESIAVAGVLALMTGGLCLLVGVLRFGYVAELLSRPVQLGYLNGLAIVMIASQLSKLCGFESGGETVPEYLDGFFEGVADGDVNRWALGLGLACLAVIGVLAKWWRRVPGVLVAVIGSIVAVELLNLTDRGVPVVGPIPGGFPAPSIPTVAWDSLPTLLLAALGLTWVTLTDTTALSRGLAARQGDRVDPNSEIMALGASNISAGLFRGFPVSASTSRTATAQASGGRSQMVGVISAILIVVLLVVGSGLVESLPTTALAAVVIAAAVHLFDMEQLVWLARARRSEFLLSIAATLGVILLGVLTGILIAVALSLGNFIRRLWRPYDAVLGRVENRRGYHDVRRHPDARFVPGLLLFRFDAPLFFANAEHFARRVQQAILEYGQPVKRVVITAEPITDIDTSGALTLEQLLDDLDAQGIELGFAELKGPIKDRLHDYGLAARALEFSDPTVGKSVSRYLRDHDVEWSDWADG
jgi:high affinity sulfate transporter 1